MVRYSKYLSVREKAGIVALFHELHPQPVFMSSPLWSFVQTNPHLLPNELLTKLKMLKLVIQNEEIDKKSLNDTLELFGKRVNNFKTLYLILTQKCNFSCAYCPIPDIEKEKQNYMMTPETVIKAFKVWKHYLKTKLNTFENEYNIILYGGEPLLHNNFRSIVSILIQLIEKSEFKIKILLATNGFLIDEDLADFLSESKIITIVGIDGLDHAQNQFRVTNTAQNTQAEVYKSLKLLIAKNIHTCISMTMLPNNLESIPATIQAFRALGVKQVGLNFLKGKYLYQFCSKTDEVSYYEKASDIVISNFILNKDSNYEYLFAIKYDNFNNQIYFPTDCSGYGNQLVVFPNGNIGNCGLMEESNHNIFNLHNPIDSLFSLSWLNRLPIYNPHCAACDSKSLCGGGCGWSAFEKTGNLEAIDLAMCIFNKKAFDYILWNYLEMKMPKVYE